jgi:hypothetical protein
LAIHFAAWRDSGLEMPLPVRLTISMPGDIAAAGAFVIKSLAEHLRARATDVYGIPYIFN